MPHILQEVAVLQREGKLHQRLVTRTRMFLAIAFVLFLIVAYNVLAAGTNTLAALGLAILGYVVGVLVFSRMTPVAWNEKTEMIESGSMGTLGWSLVGLYVVFEIAARTELARILPAGGTEGYVLALIFGVILGRAIGVVIEIHRVYRKTHAS